MEENISQSQFYLSFISEEFRTDRIFVACLDLQKYFGYTDFNKLNKLHHFVD